ncbi:MAG TPA: hypothetical protein VGM64_17415 [Lacunisphaera sp.]
MIGLAREKPLHHNGELYVLAGQCTVIARVATQARAGKEPGMRQRRLKVYWQRLAELQHRAPPQSVAQETWCTSGTRRRIATGLVTVAVGAGGELPYELNPAALRRVRSHEGRYLLIRISRPAMRSWSGVVTCNRVCRGEFHAPSNLGLRSIFRQRPDRIEVHSFVAFLTYCRGSPYSHCSAASLVG